jgi:copper chaperone CopZ
MMDCGHPTPVGFQTIEVRVPGANCPWCFNEAMDKVRGVDGVAEVRASILDDCIEIQHRDASMPLLIETLRTYLHGTDDSPHDCQMTAIEPELVALSCGCARPTATNTRPDPALPMETLVEAMTRLRTSGYHDDFMATPEGNLVCRSCGTHHEPETIEIQQTVRFEGDSNPDDEAILFALSCDDGCLGQYSSAFGSETATADMKVLARLPPTRR